MGDGGGGGEDQVTRPSPLCVFLYSTRSGRCGEVCLVCLFFFPGVYWSVRAFFCGGWNCRRRRNELFYSSELYLVVLADVDRTQRFHLVA